jgi:transcription initiation factor TFIIE subunit alpha
MLNDPLVHNMLSTVVQEEENFPIVESLFKGTNTDESIAEETEIKLNIVRKVLYRLYDSGLASYKRSKDPETQWYTYSWKFDPEGVNNQIRHTAEDMITNLKEDLEIEQDNMFFVCQGCGDSKTRYPFDKSSEYGFQCPNCGGELVFQDNQPIIDKIKEDILNYQKTFDSV